MTNDIDNKWDLERKVSPAISWSNVVNSNPIEDLRSWQKTVGNWYGIYGNIINLNEKTLSLVKDSWQTKKYLETKTADTYNVENLLWGTLNLNRNESIFQINVRMKDGEVTVGLKNDSIGELRLRDPCTFVEASVI